MCIFTRLNTCGFGSVGEQRTGHCIVVEAHWYALTKEKENMTYNDIFYIDNNLWFTKCLEQ